MGLAALPAVRYQDANFRYKNVWLPTQSGEWAHRWMPTGMPRLNSRIKNAIAFVYQTDPGSGKPTAVGTASIIGFPRIDSTNHWRAYRHAYAVTCRHVVEDGANLIRINIQNGESRFIDCDPLEWVFHDDADLAAIDITASLCGDDDVAVLPFEWLSSQTYISDRQIDIGEDGFLLGLFAEEPGSRRNIIAARFGNLSILSSEEAPLLRSNGIRLSAHVFDMRLRTGFSGSPVFIYRTP